MRITSFPVKRAERNLCIGSLLADLQDSVPNHKIICKDFFLTMRVTKHWDRLPRAVVESLSTEVLKSCSDIFLGNRLWVTLSEQEVGPDDLHRSLPTSTNPGFRIKSEPHSFGFIQRQAGLSLGKHNNKKKTDQK